MVNGGVAGTPITNVRALIASSKDRCRGSARELLFTIFCGNEFELGVRTSEFGIASAGKTHQQGYNRSAYRQRVNQV